MIERSRVLRTANEGGGTSSRRQRSLRSGLFALLCCMTGIDPRFIAPQNLLLTAFIATLRLLVGRSLQHLEIMLLGFRGPTLEPSAVCAGEFDVFVKHFRTPTRRLGRAIRINRNRGVWNFAGIGNQPLLKQQPYSSVPLLHLGDQPPLLRAFHSLMRTISVAARSRRTPDLRKRLKYRPRERLVRHLDSSPAGL